MKGTTASQILHEIGGSPEVDGAVPVLGADPCWICGAMFSRGIPIAKWGGANFTDQNKARCQHATHVCESCAWSCLWVVPPGFPEPSPGKKGLNLRLFSHLWHDGDYRPLNKASKPEILAWLRADKSGPWFAAIADTGQKHVLPWTPVNHGSGGVVRFEERDIPLPSVEGWSMVDDMIDLLSDGVTKDELGSGDYSARSYQTCGRNRLFEFESTHGKQRGSAWFDLARWLSQRNEGEYVKRGEARGAAAKNGRGNTGDAKIVSSKRSEPNKTLAANPRPCKDGSEDKRVSAGLDINDVQSVAAPSGEQLALFGDSRAK